MYQSQSINDQFIYQDFSTQNQGSEVPYPANCYSYDYNYYGSYHTNYQSYQSPNNYYGKYNFLNSNSYPYTDYYNKTTYSENTLGTSNLDSTGNSLNNSNSQVFLSPNITNNSEVSFSYIPKKSRNCLTRKQQLPDNAVDLMNDWFQDHINNPYPTLEDKERLAKQGGITVKQVTAWFSNRRNRSQNTKPKRIKRAIEHEMSEMINELAFNPDKTQIIEKFRKTIMNH